MAFFDRNIEFIKNELKMFDPKMKRLVDLDLFVLDNSLRETTVGQVKGHTLENKWEIYEETKKANFKYLIVESFNHMTNLGDTFLKELKKKGEDMSYMFAFTEFVDGIDDQRVPKESIPIGLTKSKNLGIKNVIMEIDLVYYRIDYKIFNSKKICQLLSERFKWIRENLSQDSLVFINFRDFSECMKYHPKRVFRLVNFLSSLSENDRPFGLMYEELGKYLPEEIGVWTKAVRKEMDDCGWKKGHLLVHVHEQWGMSDAVQVAALANGANGIWAGICEEGAALGHASSCLTIMNLIRMGNKKVREKYNCKYLREAAQKITNITTGDDPHPKQAVYGARSLDVLFGVSPKRRTEFDYLDFLEIKPELRISTVATAPMIVCKLKEYFGEDEQFTLEMGEKMREKIHEHLHEKRKEEYDSKVGLAMLFDQSGGKPSEAMADVIAAEQSCTHIDCLIEDIRKEWDIWDVRDGVKDDHLEFDAFYDGFMAPYFSCYRCDDTQLGLKAIDMDEDGKVDWKEFAVYLKWAGRQYPNTRRKEGLKDIAFRKGLMPAMYDKINEERKKGCNDVCPPCQFTGHYFDTCHEDDVDFFKDEDEINNYPVVSKHRFNIKITYIPSTERVLCCQKTNL